ncbi:MAG: hypothetical protein IAE95_04980 [Chitinophagaceae bacterium]|nr:hypothetical protein [Chitinophagaceae bacterium]
MFSGKFGTGKSYFLRNFFANKSDEYCLFWISPVNYVVGANNDIFEWIKIDIAKELLASHLPSKKGSRSKAWTMQNFLFLKSGQIFAHLLTNVASHIIKSKTGVDFLEDFKTTIKQFDQFEKSSAENEQSDFSKLDKHISSATNITGSIFEDDIVTQILRASIEYIKIHTRKECVLLIDDLDRLDPEHIFRVLNIMSSHNDHFEGNKFGFSKVILVCDVDNVKHIFEHRYGPKCDFNGYIEKYYTYDPFLYSIQSAITMFCTSSEISEVLDGDTSKLLGVLLREFVEMKLLNVRNIKKISSMTYRKVLPIMKYENILRDVSSVDKVRYYRFISNDTVDVDYNNFPFLFVVYILSIAFGGYLNLVEACKKMIEKNSSIETELLPSVINSIGILSFVIHIKPFGKPISCFVLTEPRLRNDGVIAHPRMTFLRSQFQIPLKWSKATPYLSGHYFQLRNNSSLYVLIYSDINKVKIEEEFQWGAVAGLIIEIIKFAKRNSLFENIDTQLPVVS